MVDSFRDYSFLLPDTTPVSDYIELVKDYLSVHADKDNEILNVYEMKRALQQYQHTLKLLQLFSSLEDFQLSKDQIENQDE